MPRPRWIACLFLLGLLASGTARAGFVYSFDQANSTASPGGRVTVRVYLEQTSTTTLLGDEGLFSAAVRISFGPAATVARVGDILPDSRFDDVQVLRLTGSTVELSLAAFANPTVFPAPGENRILLASLVFTAGGAPGVSQVTATDLTAGLDETVSGQGTALDGLIANGSATVTVGAAVPEPGSLTLLAAGIATLAAAGRRRRLARHR